MNTWSDVEGKEESQKNKTMWERKNRSTEGERREEREKERERERD